MTVGHFTGHFNESEHLGQNLFQNLQNATFMDNFCKELIDDSDKSKTEWPQLVSNICKNISNKESKEADLVISKLIKKIYVLEKNRENSKSLTVKISDYIGSFSFFNKDAANLKIVSLKESFKGALETAQSHSLESTTLMLLRKMDPWEAYLEIVTMRLKSLKTHNFEQLKEKLKLKIPIEIQKTIEEVAQINLNKHEIKSHIKKEILLSLAPFLTYVNLENYSFETWTSEEVNRLVASCKHTTFLNIHSNKLTKIETLPYCKYLNCSNCKNLTVIDILPKCAILNCTDCSALNSLQGLPQCEELYCTNCSQLISLPSLPECTTLTCSHCSKLISLPDLQKCICLYCDYCIHLTSLPILSQCFILYCDHCTQLTFLPSLPQCTTLYCDHCPQLISLSDLPKCLHLNCFNCTKLPSLPDLPLCTTLNCKNCIELASLPNLPHCTNLDCTNCPKLTTLKVNINDLKESPFKILSELSNILSNLGTLPKIIFLNEDGEISEGIDSGGLQRQLIGDLFLNLFQDRSNGNFLVFRKESEGIFPQLPENRLNDTKHYESMGLLLGYLAFQKHPIGQIFSPKFFEALSIRLNEEESPQANAKVYCILKSLDVVLAILNGKSKDFTKKELNILQSFLYADEDGFLDNDAKTIEDLNDVLTNAKKDITKLIQEKIGKLYLLDPTQPNYDYTFGSENKAISFIALGMINQCDDLKLTQLKALHPEELQEKIQGNLTSATVLSALKFSYQGKLGEKERKKNIKTTSFLNKWIKEQNPDQLKSFLRAVTGSSSLFKKAEILIELKNPDDIQTLPTSHTCFLQLDLPISYESEETFNSKMKLFIEESQAGTGFQYM